MTSLESVKAEITFFMEKGFQFSFVYVGAVFAAVATLNVGTVKAIFHLPEENLSLLIVPALLLLNFLYLVVASSCLFAILKRGYFILANGQSSEGDSLTEVAWERFVRRGTDGPTRRFGSIAWNIDNYYTVVVCLLIVALSVVLAVYGVAEFPERWKAVPLVLLLLHVIPAWFFLRTKSLNDLCHRLVDASRTAAAQRPSQVGQD